MTRVPPPWLAPAPKTAVPTASAAPSPHSSGGRAGGVDVDDGEVAVAVDSRRRCRASRRPSANVTVTSSPRRLWALVRTLPVGDDDAGAARAAADPDDGRADALGDGGDGGLELFDGAHGWLLSGCSLRLAIDL